LTRLPQNAPNGKQQPRVLTRPQFDSEADAEDAIMLVAACGQELDPWQRLLVRMTLATKGGRLAAAEVGALVARQNGKGGFLEAIAIWSLFVGGGFTLWTAHELKTSDEAYLRVKSLIQSSEDLSAEVVKWDGGLTGQHIIELRSGARLAFLARSRSSGRGMSPQRVIFDEAQQFSALAFRAMMYATSAQGHRRQVIFVGTVPGPENDSAVWTGVRDRGRKGESARLAWAEWTPKGSDDPRVTIDPQDWTVRAWANPALGSRILHETIDAEWEAAQADLEGFMRERLSVWPSVDSASTGVVDAAGWEAGTVDLEPVTGPLVLSVEVSQDRTKAWLMVVGSRADGRAQIELVPTVRDGSELVFRGVALLPGRVAEVVADNTDVEFLVLDGYGAAATLREDFLAAMRAAGRTVDLIELSGPDYVDACAKFADGVVAASFTHARGKEMDDSVRVVDKRDRDGVWTFARAKSGAAAGPVFAAVCGLWMWAQVGAYDLEDSYL